MNSPAAESASDPTPTQPAVPELLLSDEFSQYLLSAKSDMFAVFRGLAEHVSQVSMVFNEGRDMLLTSLVGWGDEGLTFDLGASADTNRKALKAEKLFCVARLERVEIQFILRRLQRIEVDGRSVFHAQLPDSILRLQRRESYRLSTPVARPLKCKILIFVEEGPPQLIEAHVANISCGGVFLSGLPLGVLLEPGLELPGCGIELPDVGPIVVTLRLCWVTEAVNRSGGRAKRAGCEFVNLPPPMATLVQRYIIKTERERKARESGMD